MGDVFASEWTYRKVYTLMVLVYNQRDPKHPPVVFKSGKPVHFDQSPRSTRWLLLGLKQRGFGQGRWNGFGGKIHSDDRSPKAGALRELKEECDLDVPEDKVQEIGRLWFTFTEKEECMEVHVFMCPDWTPSSNASGQLQWPSDTEEMHPSWFPIGTLGEGPEESTILNTSKIPFNNMWPDDRIWLPKALQGKRFLGWLHFAQMLQPSKPSRPELLADCSRSTNNLLIAPYEVPAYRMEFFPPSYHTEHNGVVEGDDCGLPNFSIQSMVQHLQLDSDDNLKQWMSSKSKMGPWNSELLIFS